MSSHIARLRTRTYGIGLGLGLVAAMFCGASCTLDPVASAQEAAFEKEEDFGPVEDSEYHRPGQDCLACHGPRGSANSKFEVAGTVFWSTCIDPDGGPDICVRTTVDHAEVRLHDLGRSTKCVYTNCAGNFFVRVGKWASSSTETTPQYPILSAVRKQSDEGTVYERVMTGHISRWGSCNDCHRTSPYWNSAGQIYLVNNPAEVPPSAKTAYEKCFTEQVSVDGAPNCAVSGN